MRQPTADPVHQHDPDLQPGRCCANWPPANRVTTVGTVGSILNSGRLIHTAAYTARLLAVLAAVMAVHTLLLPATTAWAHAHGIWGWTLWMAWAAVSLAALHHGVLTRRRSRTAVHVLHIVTVAAVLMAIAAPGGWIQALTATAGAAGAWLTAIRASRR